MNFCDFFSNMFNSKAIKVHCRVRCSSVISSHIQSRPMSFYWSKLIKIYYTCPILYFRQIISWINTIKFRFVLVIILYFNFSLRMRRYQKSLPALIVSSPALIMSLPVNRFPNKLAPNSILRNPPVVLLLYF